MSLSEDGRIYMSGRMTTVVVCFLAYLGICPSIHVPTPTLESIRFFVICVRACVGKLPMVSVESLLFACQAV
jgi:hypothetical protein